MSEPIVTLADCSDPCLVGGKAAALGALLRAGFPVPDGFVALPPASNDDIGRAYRAMGSPPVAVRSSAAVEDGETASFAGQFETILGVEGEAQLHDAIRRCRAAFAAAGAEYGRAMRAGDASPCVPLLVQHLIPADAAGVLFTADPLTGNTDIFSLEAAPGTGEGVVSGAVQPERLTIDASDGTVLDAIRPASAGCDRPTLNSSDVDALWRLARKVAEHRGAPQDIEWAIVRSGSDAGVYLLQARPITTLARTAETRACRDEMRAWLRERHAAGAGPWALHNLAESAPHPTPLSAGLLRRFLSGAGGFGALYRMLGYEPAECVGESGILDFIAGRPYVDLSRAPLLLSDNWPYRYDADKVRRRPSSADEPPTAAAGSLFERMRASGAERQATARLDALSQQVRGFEEGLYRDFAAWCVSELKRDGSDIAAHEWEALWSERVRRIYDEFAPQALLPALLLSRDMERLRDHVSRRLSGAGAAAQVQSLLAGGERDASLRENDDLRRVARGEMPLDDWMARYGHRGPGETDIGAPRWRERRHDVARRADSLSGAASPTAEPIADAAPGAMDGDTVATRLIDDIRLWSRLREEGRSLMARGTDLLRRQAMAAGDRLGIGEDVFLLEQSELLAPLRTGYVPLERIERRRRRRRAEQGLHLPAFIGAEEIETAGEPTPLSEGGEGLAISAGVATGPAAVLETPDGEMAEGSVLICPSTDPSWTPLFLRASALVVERGGMLSHGAVIARELGIPAVVLPDATRRFRTGEIVTVDGSRGRVAPSGEAVPHAVHRELARPARDRAASLRRAAAVALPIWLIVIAAVLLAPREALLAPILAAHDAVLWPLVPLFGRAGAVATIAAITALILAGLEGLCAGRVRATDAKNALMVSLTPAALLLGLLVFLLLWMGDRFGPAVAYADPGAAVSVVAMVDSEMRGTVTLRAPALSVDGGAQTVPPIRETLERQRTRWQAPSDLSAMPWEARAAAMKARTEMLADLDRYLRAGVPPQPLHWSVRLPERAGRYPVEVVAAGEKPVRGAIAVGATALPAEPAVAGDGAVRSLRIHYRRPDRTRRFWTPLARLGYPNADFGWLGVYLTASLVVTFGVRWLRERLRATRSR